MTRRREHPGGDSDSDGYRRPPQGHRPPDRRRYPHGNGRPPDGGGQSRRRYPNGHGRLPGRGGYPGGGPLEIKDPLMEMEDPLDLSVDENHLALKGPLDQ